MVTLTLALKVVVNFCPHSSSISPLLTLFLTSMGVNFVANNVALENSAHLITNVIAYALHEISTYDPSKILNLVDNSALVALFCRVYFVTISKLFT